MEKISNLGAFLKSKKKILFVVLGILAVVLIIAFLREKNNQEQTIIAKIGDFKNQVSVSGKVIPSQNVDLGFKNSGRVERVYFSSDKSEFVKTGSLLAQIEAKDARKDLNQAEIDLAEAKLALAKHQLENSNSNMDSDLQLAYDNGFSAVSEAFLDLSSIINHLDDILDDYDVSESIVRNSGDTALKYKRETESLYYKADKFLKTYEKVFRLLNRDSSKEDIEKNINQIYETTKIIIDALKSAKNLVDYLAKYRDNEADYADLKNTLYEDTNTTNEHLSSLLSVKTKIKDAKDSFEDTDLNTQSLKLTIKQKENDLEEAKSILEDYYIRAPFDGIITKIDAKVGEIVSSNTPLISMMSLNTFQIESFVPEVGIALVKLNDMASITLDAYGDSVIFSAKVVSVDPAETIRDGVSTYKVKLQFMDQDSRILSGMTANVLIDAVSKPNVIVLPQGVILGENGKKFVQVKRDGENVEVEITTGSVSSLGQVEITSGVNDGDVIILNPVTK